MSDPDRPFMTFTLDNAWVIDFETDSGGVLRLGPRPPLPLAGQRRLLLEVPLLRRRVRPRRPRRVHAPGSHRPGLLQLGPRAGARAGRRPAARPAAAPSPERGRAGEGVPAPPPGG